MTQIKQYQDDIPRELLKQGGDDLHTRTWKLFTRMWEEKQVPKALSCQ